MRYIIPSLKIVRFSRWNRKGYAIFASLGKQIRITALALSICDRALEKSSGKGGIIREALGGGKREGAFAEEEQPPPEEMAQQLWQLSIEPPVLPCVVSSGAENLLHWIDTLSAQFSAQLSAQRLFLLKVALRLRATVLCIVLVLSSANCLSYGNIVSNKR